MPYIISSMLNQWKDWIFISFIWFSNLVIMNVPDEGYSNLVIMNVPDEGYSNLVIMNVPDEGYCRNAPRTLD